MKIPRTFFKIGGDAYGYLGTKLTTKVPENANPGLNWHFFD
ncbi:MAG: hypothetical protein V4723_15190 [Pseudomonadota bacterium]